MDRDFSEGEAVADVKHDDTDMFLLSGDTLV